MKGLLLFTLAVSLSVATVTGSVDDLSSSKHNDTAAEVLIDEVGDVKMEDPSIDRNYEQNQKGRT